MRTFYNIFIANIFIANQANQWDGWCCLPWRRISMSGSMDELDKSRMSFRWRSERRKRRRDFMYVIRHTSQLRHLLDATTNGAGRKAHALKDRPLRTDGVHHSDVALLDEVPIREWLHPASKDAGNIITGTHYLVGLSSLLAEERSCFLQVADTLSMASFLSAGDIDPKCDARCSASQWRRKLNYLRTATVFKYNIMRHWAVQSAP